MFGLYDLVEFFVVRSFDRLDLPAIAVEVHCDGAMAAAGVQKGVSAGIVIGESTVSHQYSSISIVLKVDPLLAIVHISSRHGVITGPPRFHGALGKLAKCVVSIRLVVGSIGRRSFATRFGA